MKIFTVFSFYYFCILNYLKLLTFYQFNLYKMLVELNRKNICSQTKYSVKVKHFLGIK